jgi:hypothetical protein
MDIKVQLYLVVEIDLGLYNELIYRRFLVENIDANPYLGLIRLSIDQSVVVKSRILWERIMNFVYYLETGEDLETKKSKKQSKKAEFFEYTRESAENKWSYLADYEPYVNWFDEKLRTPEVHKGSTLRGHFVAGEAVNSVGVLSLLNISANVFWQGLFEIIQGRDVHFKLRLPALDALLGGNETTAGTHHAV